MFRNRKISVTSVMQPYIGRCWIIGCLALVIIASACGSTTPGGALRSTGELAAPLPRYSMIFIIHGDGDYLYHDSLGIARNADEEAMNAAIHVALRNPEAEVFIFHQRPARHVLLLFPLKDGTFRYYRNGELIVEDTYWRADGASRFEAEIALYQQFNSTKNAKRARFFLYYGHEISEFEGAGYDASYPDRTCNVRDLSDGLKSFTGDSTRFDLIVLSTCFGGTPHTIAALAPFAQTVVASPDNLHLSYLDLRPFERIDTYVRDEDVSGFARFFARRAFSRLANDVQTAVTVAVYDVQRTQKYLQAADSLYVRQLSEMRDHAPSSIEYVDCNEEGTYVLPGMSDGVFVLYRPARFGRSKDKSSHSGWQCCRPLPQ
jgi:hypothetical protein